MAEPQILIDQFTHSPYLVTFLVKKKKKTFHWDDKEKCNFSMVIMVVVLVGKKNILRLPHRNILNHNPLYHTLSPDYCQYTALISNRSNWLLFRCCQFTKNQWFTASIVGGARWRPPAITAGLNYIAYKWQKSNMNPHTHTHIVLLVWQNGTS